MTRYNTTFGIYLNRPWNLLFYQKKGFIWTSWYLLIFTNCERLIPPLSVCWKPHKRKCFIFLGRSSKLWLNKHSMIKIRKINHFQHIKLIIYWFVIKHLWPSPSFQRFTSSSYFISLMFGPQKASVCACLWCWRLWQGLLTARLAAGFFHTLFPGLLDSHSQRLVQWGVRTRFSLPPCPFILHTTPPLRPTGVDQTLGNSRE